jgi:hypothetical protein
MFTGASTLISLRGCRRDAPGRSSARVMQVPRHAHLVVLASPLESSTHQNDGDVASVQPSDLSSSMTSDPAGWRGERGVGSSPARPRRFTPPPDPLAESRWDPSQLDRRASPRAEYRRTPPARLDVAGQACAVRDMNTNGLRVEPAPPGRVWFLGQAVSGLLYLRTIPPMPIAGRILRVGATGLVIVPDGSGAWPGAAAIETERNELGRRPRLDSHLEHD